MIFVAFDPIFVKNVLWRLSARECPKFVVLCGFFKVIFCETWQIFAQGNLDFLVPDPPCFRIPVARALRAEVQDVPEANAVDVVPVLAAVMLPWSPWRLHPSTWSVSLNQAGFAKHPSSFELVRVITMPDCNITGNHDRLKHAVLHFVAYNIHALGNLVQNVLLHFFVASTFDVAWGSVLLASLQMPEIFANCNVPFFAFGQCTDVFESKLISERVSIKFDVCDGNTGCVGQHCRGLGCTDQYVFSFVNKVLVSVINFDHDILLSNT